MARFITQLLIVSLLTLNIAWAADECAFTYPGEAGIASFHVDGDSTGNPANTDFDCDDWCSAWMSVVALSGMITLDGYATTTVHSGFYILFFSSLTVAPPFHPPIA